MTNKNPDVIIQDFLNESELIRPGILYIIAEIAN